MSITDNKSSRRPFLLTPETHVGCITIFVVIKFLLRLFAWSVLNIKLYDCRSINEMLQHFIYIFGKLLLIYIILSKFIFMPFFILTISGYRVMKIFCIDYWLKINVYWSWAFILQKKLLIFCTCSSSSI